VTLRAPWLQGLFRVGYIARGLVYLVPGVLALRLVIGAHGPYRVHVVIVGGA